MAFFVRPEERLVYPGVVVFRPVEHDQAGTDVKLGQSVYTVIPNIVANKIKPVSLNNEPWTGFGSLENRTFTDDFSHDKELTVKAQATSYNGSTIKIKEAANINNGFIKLKDEVKLWFPLFARLRSTLHLRLTSDATRVHYDHGIENVSGRDFNIYGSFGFLRNWQNYNFKLGVTYLEKNANIDTRLRVTKNHNVTLYHRSSLRHHELRFGLIGVLDLTNRKLIKKDLLVGYEKGDVDVSLKALQPFGKETVNYGNWKELFDTYTLTTVFRRNAKERYGLELTGNPTKNLLTATGLVEYKYHNKGVTKIKFDNNLDLTLVVKNTITDKLSLSVGALIPIKRETKVVGEGEVASPAAKNKVGVTLDFNI